MTVFDDLRQAAEVPEAGTAAMPGMSERMGRAWQYCTTVALPRRIAALHLS